MNQRWRDVVAEEFHDLAARLPAMAAAAPITLCGMSACVDARVNMAHGGALFAAGHPDEAAAFASLLLERAARGIGGEVRVAWADGPRWLAERLEITYALGGVGMAYGPGVGGVPVNFGDINVDASNSQFTDQDQINAMGGAVAEAIRRELVSRVRVNT